MGIIIHNYSNYFPQRVVKKMKWVFICGVLKTVAGLVISSSIGSVIPIVSNDNIAIPTEILCYPPTPIPCPRHSPHSPRGPQTGWPWPIGNTPPQTQIPFSPPTGLLQLPALPPDRALLASTPTWPLLPAAPHPAQPPSTPPRCLEVPQGWWWRMTVVPQ